MSNPWFRMYVDFLDDPKMIALAFEDQRHYIGLLALKCAGVLDQNATPETLSRVIAQRMWIDHAVIADVKKRLVGGGLIDDSWQPLAWDKRQRKSDIDWTRAERQQRHREKNALRNGEVTPPEEKRIEEKREDTDIKTRGCRLWHTWGLDQEYIDAALGIREIDLDELKRVADEFRDYWISVPGSKGVKMDWLATWRNWVRRAKTSAAITVKKTQWVND